MTEHEKGVKAVSESVGKWSKIINYEDLNAFGRLFGGRLMEWIDEASVLTAMRHSGTNVITASVDNLQFKEGAYLGEIVVLISKITYVGRSSIEVRTDTYVEYPESGLRKLINRAYLTEVCVDNDGRPVPVPYGLKLETDEEKAEYEDTKRRIAMRRQRRVDDF